MDLNYRNTQRGLAMKINSKVFTLGNSNAVRIPRSIMRCLSLKPDDNVTIEVVNKEIIIRKALPSSVRELFKDYHGTYQAEELLDDGFLKGTII